MGVEDYCAMCATELKRSPHERPYNLPWMGGVHELVCPKCGWKTETWETPDE